MADALQRLVNFQQTAPTQNPGFQNGAFQLASSPSGTDPATGLPIYPASVEVPNTGGVSIETANYTLQAADCGKLIVANSASAITFTLPATIPFPQWQVRIANIGAGVLSLVPGGSLDLDGSTSAITIQQFSSVSIATDGSNYFSARGGGGSSGSVAVAGLTVDGGGSTPAAGVKGFVQIPYGGTITGWSIVADQAGSASVDVWKVASSAPPAVPGVPNVGNKISASAPAALSSAQSASAGSSGVSTWTTAVAQWDVIGFNLTAASTVTRITLLIFIDVPAGGGGGGGGGGSGITQLTGDVAAGPGSGSEVATVEGIQGVPVSATAPTSGQALVFNGTAWAPAAGGGGSGISQLTGDVLAGPGSGSQAATVAAIQGVPVSSTPPTTGQVLEFNGTDWVPATSSGGGPTFVDDETVSSASGTAWTLANTPSPAASLQLFQYLAGFGCILLRRGTDYTLSGATITTTNSIAAGTLFAWYRY